MGLSKKYQTGNQQGKKKVRTHETQWRRGRQKSSDDGPQFVITGTHVLIFIVAVFSAAWLAGLLPDP